MSVIPFPGDRSAGPPIEALDAELIRLRRIAARVGNETAIAELIRDGLTTYQSADGIARAIKAHVMAE